MQHCEIMCEGHIAFHPGRQKKQRPVQMTIGLGKCSHWANDSIGLFLLYFCINTTLSRKFIPIFSLSQSLQSHVLFFKRPNLRIAFFIGNFPRANPFFMLYKKINYSFSYNKNIFTCYKYQI